MPRPRSGLLRLVFFSALGLGLVLGLVWAMVFRENNSRRLYIQFEAYRASTLLLEAYRENPAASFIGGPVLGFGIYDGEGRGLLVQGSAPESISPAAAAGAAMEFMLGPSGRSTRLVRALRTELQGLRGSMGQGGAMPPGMGQGMGPGMMRGFRGRQGSEAAGAPAPWVPGPVPPPSGAFVPPSPDSPGAAPPSASFRAPRTLWLDYDDRKARQDRTSLMVGASIVSAALLGFYLVLVHLFKRNASLEEREARNRELVQLGEAARTLVHEIKNPLGIIRVQAGALKRRAPDNPHALHAAEIIEDEVHRLAELADRIREFLKGGEGEAAELDLGVFLAEYSARYEREDGLSSPRVELAKDLPSEARIVADPGLLARALDNLVRNAYEADPEGQVDIGLLGKGATWELAVADRGPGVSPELVSRLFEPFFTTKEKGSGIGLALAKRIVEGAHGRLRYEPRPGGGALFTISLPKA